MKRFLTLVLSAVVLTPPGAARAEFIVGLTTTNGLVTFDSATPGTVSGVTAITGLVGGAGEAVVGIDYRPVDGALVALTRQQTGGTVGQGRVYTINLSNGAATLINGNLTDATGAQVLLSEADAGGYGVDFNPVPNALRVVNNANQNLRIVGGGTGVTNVDGSLNPGDPTVSAVGYTNSVPGTVTSTTLFDLDLSGTPQLAIQNPPNDGTLAGVGPLGLNPLLAVNIGFDISGDTGVAYASYRNPAGNEVLYTIDLATGQSSVVGAIGVAPGTLRDITVAPAVPEPASLALLSVGAAGLLGYARRRG